MIHEGIYIKLEVLLHSMPAMPNERLHLPLNIDVL